FTSSGTRSTFASGLVGPRGLAFDAAKNLFVADYLGGTIYKYTSGGVQTTFATFDPPGNRLRAMSKFDLWSLSALLWRIALVVAGGHLLSWLVRWYHCYDPVGSGCCDSVGLSCVQDRQARYRESLIRLMRERRHTRAVKQVALCVALLLLCPLSSFAFCTDQCASDNTMTVNGVTLTWNGSIYQGTGGGHTYYSWYCITDHTCPGAGESVVVQ